MAEKLIPCQKRCSKCGKSKSTSHFSPRANRPGKRQSQCKSCRNEDNERYRNTAEGRRLRAAASKKWRQSNLQHVREYAHTLRLANIYGIAREDYLRLLESQGGACGICQKPPSEGKHLNVDHCHSTGAIRGLLCGQCNLGLGILGDNAESLTRAVKYLADEPVPEDMRELLGKLGRTRD